MNKFFFAVVITCICLQFSAGNVSASEEDMTLKTTTSYELSYPGLLPDHPLFFMKQARDTMLSLLISKPLERASFMLLQSDKQVSAAYLMAKQHKDTQMVTLALTSSQETFEESLKATQEAKQQGMETKDMIEKLRLASKKHAEIITCISSELDEKEQTIFTQIGGKSHHLVTTTASIRP